MNRCKKTLTALALCVSMLLSGCSDNSNSGSKTEMEKPEKFTLTSSTEAGNSGDVTLQKGDTYAVISVRNFGDIKVKLYPDIMPYEVYNFTELAKRGDYNGRTFHRIIEGFMIQGGGSGGGASECYDGGTFQVDVNTSLRHYYGAFCYAASGKGDISDGFYIINNKTPQADIATKYDNVALSNAYSFTQYKAVLETLDPSNANYLTYYQLCLYYKGFYEAVNAMKETITDDVINTYATKGGYAGIDGGYTVFGQTVEGFDVIDKISTVEKTAGADGSVSKPVEDIIIDKVEIFTME